MPVCIIFLFLIFWLICSQLFCSHSLIVPDWLELISALMSISCQSSQDKKYNLNCLFNGVWTLDSLVAVTQSLLIFPVECPWYELRELQTATRRFSSHFSFTSFLTSPRRGCYWVSLISSSPLTDRLSPVYSLGLTLTARSRMDRPAIRWGLLMVFVRIVWAD